MKTLDMLAKACEPEAPAAAPTPDLSKITDDIVDKIAARVIAQLTQPADDPAPDPEPDPDPEGGEPDAGKTAEPGPVD